MLPLGIIGIGNMGEAILHGILAQKVASAQDIVIYDINTEKIERLHAELGVKTASSLQVLLETCESVLLAVKPNVCEKVLRTCPDMFEGKMLLSIVTGWSRKRLLGVLPESCRILRIMPNTPCLVGAGMAAFDLDHTLNPEELDWAQKIFKATGRVAMVPSYLMDAVTGVSGSGPAYVYMFIEALADGGVRAGLQRDIAYELAAQTVLGAAKMVLDTGKHPGALKDAVCSPGGTTIEAVASLERAQLRSAVIDAVDVCCKKAQELSK